MKGKKGRGTKATKKGKAASRGAKARRPKEDIHDSILELVGNTPMLRLSKIAKYVAPEVCVKLEFFNPTHSVKDRIGACMIADAERRGVLKKGMTIVEPTTGNTGIALSMAAAVKGYRMIVVMPEFVSEERRKVVSAFGAEVVLVPKEKGIEGVLAKAMEIKERGRGDVFMPNQFCNPCNTNAHCDTTGHEIVRQTGGRLDAFLAAAGTGGTIGGISKVLRKKVPKCRIYIIEPATSAILSGGPPGYHGIQGIGEGFVPEILKRDMYDEVIAVKDEDAFEMARRLAREEGIFCGPSSGANVWAALEVAKKMSTGRVVTLIPDLGDRYLSTDLFSK